MFVFVAGVVVGLLVAESRELINPATPDAARIVDSMASLGYFLAVNSATLGFAYAWTKKPGVTGWRSRRTQSLVVAITVPIGLIPLYGVAPFCAAATFRTLWIWVFGGALLLVVLSWIVSPVGRTCRDVEEHPESRCHQCGYTLIREQQRCPECGSPRRVQEDPSEEHDAM